MKQLIALLTVLLCLVTILFGCQQRTTVILPPETTTDATAEPTVTSTALPSTEPTAAPTAEQPELPPAESTAESTTSPTSAPATSPSAAQSTQPTATPATQPTSAPNTNPTAAPTTETTTAPTTEPTTAPTTESTSAPTTEPTTESTSAPTTEPTTEPVPTQHPVYDISNHSIGSLEYGLRDAINAKRADAELAPLTMDCTLCALGAIRAYECSESFSHTRPDGRGAFTVLSDYGYYIWSNVSERIHYGTSGLSAGTIVKGWMYNADFSANILSGDFTHLGIGIYDNGSYTYIVCFFTG